MFRFKKHIKHITSHIIKLKLVLIMFSIHLGQHIPIAIGRISLNV